jgi:hypothetical protein
MPRIHVRGADNHLQLMSLPPACDLRCGERLMRSAAWRWHGTRRAKGDINEDDEGPRAFSSEVDTGSREENAGECVDSTGPQVAGLFFVHAKFRERHGAIFSPSNHA